MNRSFLGASMLLAGAAAGVAGTQPWLAEVVHGVRDRDDVYALPPPTQLHAATLGWEAAAVDLLWSKLLVEYGAHWSEHRDFLDAPKYLDAILELEPTYALLFKYVGTLLVYRPPQGTEQDARLARAYLERGTRARPEDSTLWRDYGGFLAFTAPSFLQDETERNAWRRDGAQALAHAVELGGDAEGAITAAALLTRAGATEEAIRHLRLAYAFTEDPAMAEAHERIGKKLEALQMSAMRDAEDTVMRTIDARRRSELPFLSHDQYLLLGPSVDVARCAGLSGADDPACARDWSSIVRVGDEP